MGQNSERDYRIVTKICLEISREMNPLVTHADDSLATVPLRYTS